MIEILAAAPAEFQLFKLKIIQGTGLSKDALHVYAGLAIFLVVRLLWRWRGGWFLAWLTVLGFALSVEWLDMKATVAGSGIQPDAGHWHDIWNTMLWPTIMLITGRWLQPRNKPVEMRPADSGDFADQSLEQPPAV